MTAAGPVAFDVAGPLPHGRRTLEASAGTGKTFAVVGLATRFLAEGRATADQLLVVTFARSATRELRERLLARVAGGLDVLAGALDGRPVGDDPVDRALVAGADAAELAGRRDRLAQALADIDLATVATLHAFCAQALAALGEPALGELVEDEVREAREVAGDLFLRAAALGPEQAAALPYVRQAVELARAGIALDDPAAIRPQPSLDSWTTGRAWVAEQAHHEAARRRARARTHSHDDLLRRLCARLTDPVRGAAAAQACGGRYRVALVDEFQDTDPVQWRTLRALFPDADGADGRTLVLVGDPKQAIYRFRGADVNAYTAVRGARADATLLDDHRADRPVAEAVLALFTGQPLGHGIDVPPVRAVHDARLVGWDGPAVLVRAVPDDAPVRRTASGAMQLPSLRDAVARDVAREAAGLLGGGLGIVGPDGEAAPLGPADLAVLVRTRRQAAAVQRHLVAVGVPSVVNGVGDVLASAAARDWVLLLQALDRPASGSAARLAALTDLIGWTPADVVAADDDPLGSAWDDLHVDLHRWRAALLADGVAAALRHLSAARDLSGRLLARPDGQRRLTDLHHVAELLHAQAAQELAGTAGLLAWLQAGMADAAAAADPAPADAVAIRLERDGDAVQILTVHGAKGLEFGVVLAPYLWDVPGGTPVVCDLHDPDTDRRVVYVGTDRRDPEHQRLTDLHAQQAEEEERRLAYVAATRARHHLRVWWAPGPCADRSPLGTLLGRPAPASTTADASAAVDALALAHPGGFGRSAVDVRAPLVPVDLPTGPGPAPRLARFDRPIDRGWRRTSYSRLVGDATAVADTPGGHHDVDVATPTPGDVIAGDAEIADAVGGISSPGPVGATDAADPELDSPVPLGPVRGGADVGSAVHSVLEHLDFTAEDLPAAVARQVHLQLARHAVDLGPTLPDGRDPAEVLAVGLAAAVGTPLDPGSGLRLRDLARADRVDELAFEMPLLGPDRADDAGALLVGDLADLLDAHLPADDRLAGYADDLRRELPEVELRGFLAGFVDLLARLPDGRFLVADHKTNRLAPPGTDPLTVGRFTPAAMAAEMRHSHYPLQALIYQVAAHRYLRWRLPGYDPDRHLAGIAYLFLRGMCGPDTPVRDGMVCGVFRWRPPTALLLDVDRLLAEGARRGRAAS